MNTGTIIEKLKQYKNKCGIRAYSELLYLHSISQAQNNAYEQQLSLVGGKLLKNAEKIGAVTSESLTEFERELSNLNAVSKEYTLHMVSHAHIDMNWLWGYHETVATTLETFRTVLRLMDEYPDFTFAQSQASVYKIVEKYEPEMLEIIRKRIRERRWEVSASTWVEGDKNLASGEAQCRQILYAKKYLSELLDISIEDMRLDFEPDTFGHSVFEPEILKSAGVDWLYHCRGCEQRDIYRWRAPSGSEIIVFQEPKWYNSSLSPIFLADYPKFCAGVAQGRLRDALVVYGVGDHGGGPTRRDIETIIDMQSWPLFPKIKFGRYDEYFEEISKLYEFLPVYSGELNFIFDGCYTSQSRLKMANSLSEKRLYDADVLVALSGVKQYDKMLELAWQDTLFNQFHDILPGSCVIESREWSVGRFQDILAAANTAANGAVRALTEQIDTSGIEFDDDRLTTSEGAGIGYDMGDKNLYPFSFTERGKGSTRIWHIFNTTQYDREEFVELKVWDYPSNISNIKLEDDKGQPLQFKVISENQCFMGMHYVSKVLVRVAVKAFGYSTCILKQNDEAKPKSGLDCFCSSCRIVYGLGKPNYVLENQNIYCEFDAVTCELLSLRDKKSGTELIGSESAASFELVKENILFPSTSWRVGPAMKKINLNRNEEVRVIRYEPDEVLSVLEYSIDFFNSKLTVKVTLDALQKHLDFYVTVDWIEQCRNRSIPALRFLLNAGYECEKYRYSAGSGTIIRGEIPHDVPSLGTMELLPAHKQDAYLCLFSDCKYGFRGIKGDCGVNLLRSSDEPDPHPELGRHYMHLYVGVAEDQNEATHIVDCAMHGMCVVSGYSHGGNMPLSGELFGYKGSCIVTAIKRSDDGGIVLRLFNPEEKEETVYISDMDEAYLTDTIEQQCKRLSVVEGKVTILVSGYSYVTVVLYKKTVKPNDLQI